MKMKGEQGSPLYGLNKSVTFFSHLFQISPLFFTKAVPYAGLIG